MQNLLEVVSRQQAERVTLRNEARDQLRAAYVADPVNGSGDPEADAILLQRAEWSVADLQASIADEAEALAAADKMVDAVGANHDLSRAMQSVHENVAAWDAAVIEFNKRDTQLRVQASRHSQRTTDGDDARRRLLLNCTYEAQQAYRLQESKLLDLRRSIADMKAEIETLNVNLMPGAYAESQSNRISELGNSVRSTEAEATTLAAKMRQAIVADYVAQDYPAKSKAIRQGSAA